MNHVCRLELGDLFRRPNHPNGIDANKIYVYLGREKGENGRHLALMTARDRVEDVTFSGAEMIEIAERMS